MAFRYILDYLKHYFISNSRHGTHSPFVYKLTDEVIYDFKFKKDYSEIENRRKKLLNDCSESLSARYRKPRLDQLIYRLARFHSPDTILEVGAGTAITTAYLSKACPQSSITTLEKNALGLGQMVSKGKEQACKLDFIIMHTAHSKQDALDNFSYFLSKTHDSSLVIIEGIYSNNEMKEAWAEIKNNRAVTVTIDLFRLGLVYFRKGQAKEHFRIRF